MAGLITRREVLKNSFLVIRLYGVKVYLQCLIGGKRVTFLSWIAKRR